MPKFAANLTTLFNELAFMERFGAAAAAGFHGVECQFPYAFEAERIADELRAHRLELALHNFPPGVGSRRAGLPVTLIASASSRIASAMRCVTRKP